MALCAFISYGKLIITHSEKFGFFFCHIACAEINARKKKKKTLRILLVWLAKVLPLG